MSLIITDPNIDVGWVEYREAELGVQIQDILFSYDIIGLSNSL